tara:strand:- start:8568 stop:9443 length:876 start_codon:yes stop_codon:yes gene_type:complete
MLEFLQDLQEARMTRNENNQRVLTYTDCCERLYLSLLVVDLLRRFPKYFRSAQNYSHLTTRYPNYKSFKLSGSDLYNFMYFVDGDGSAQDKLKNPGAAKKMRSITHLPTLQINGFLTTIANGKNPDSSNSLFINVESALRISNTDYKNMRRAIGNFSTLTSEDRKKNVTRLLYAVRAKLRSSDIIDDLEKLAVEKNFEVGSVTDNEPTVSTPDIPTNTGSFVNYKFLVGAKKLFLAKKTVELAVKGASVPANIINAYLPIIKMVHDIVRAGPAFIQQLRILHKRAQKTLKD